MEKNINDYNIFNYDQHMNSVYESCWSSVDSWVMASVSYKGKVAIHTVPDEEKMKILG